MHASNPSVKPNNARVKSNKPCGPGCSCYDCYKREGKHFRWTLLLVLHSDLVSYLIIQVIILRWATVKEPLLQPTAQSESEQTSSDEDIDPGDEEKLELIFMDLVSMDVVDL